jgi:hypothetical protein
MPRIDLISKDEAMKKGDPEGYYIIRRLSPEMADEIRDRHIERIEPEAPGGVPCEKIDWRAVAWDQLDYVIQDWLVYGPDDQPAPCTMANKKWLPQGERQAILEAAGARNLRGELSAPLQPWKEASKAKIPPA